MKPEINFPNIITAARILLTPLFIWLMMSDDPLLIQLSGVIFIIAAVSDWYDGWYARRYNRMSPFGRFFDPLADKVLIGAAFFAFVSLGIFDLWMVVVIVARDLIVTLLRVVADLKRQPVVTSRLAKRKTALQLIFLCYILAVYIAAHVDWIGNALGRGAFEFLLSPWIVRGTMVVLVVLSLVTAVQYIIENRHILRSIFNGSLARTTS